MRSNRYINISAATCQTVGTAVTAASVDSIRNALSDSQLDPVRCNCCNLVPTAVATIAWCRVAALHSGAPVDRLRSSILRRPRVRTAQKYSSRAPLFYWMQLAYTSRCKLHVFFNGLPPAPQLLLICTTAACISSVEYPQQQHHMISHDGQHTILL